MMNRSKKVEKASLLFLMLSQGTLVIFTRNKLKKRKLNNSSIVLRNQYQTPQLNKSNKGGTLNEL